VKDYRVYLVHIVEAIEKIERYTADGRDSLFSQEIVLDAVLRNLSVIGEAAKRVGQEERKLYPEVPWKQMAGLRDVLIHDYEGIDATRVWAVVSHDLLIVKQQLLTALPPLDQLESEIAGE